MTSRIRTRLDGSPELVDLLAAAPGEIVSALTKDKTALQEGEFVRALACLFCQQIEAGEAPSLPLQKHLAQALPTSLSGSSPDWLVGRTSVIGRRDYLLSTEVWRERANGATTGAASRIVVGRWNKERAIVHLPAKSAQLVERAARRFAWLDVWRDRLQDCSALRSETVPPASALAQAIPESGFVEVQVPTACLVEVPRGGQRPQDREQALALCRAFVTAVDRYGGVVLPELLPYFARALRKAMGGGSLAGALGLKRDRSGRPARGGAWPGWPTHSAQDQRDLWLAREVLRLTDELPLYRRSPPIERACALAAERWTKDHRRRPVSKDIARAAWRRWGDHVRAIDSVHRLNYEREQQRRVIEDRLATLSPLHGVLWQRLVLHADREGTVVEKKLAAIALEMTGHTDFDLDAMLVNLQNVGLLQPSRRERRRRVKIPDIEQRSAMLGISKQPLPLAGSSDFHVVRADPAAPIYSRRPKGSPRQ